MAPRPPAHVSLAAAAHDLAELVGVAALLGLVSLAVHAVPLLRRGGLHERAVLLDGHEAVEAEPEFHRSTIERIGKNTPEAANDSTSFDAHGFHVAASASRKGRVKIKAGKSRKTTTRDSAALNAGSESAISRGEKYWIRFAPGP